MYNKILTNWIFPVFWDIRVRIFYQYLISMQIPALNKTKFENFYLAITFPVEGTIFQNLYVYAHAVVYQPLSCI